MLYNYHLLKRFFLPFLIYFFQKISNKRNQNYLIRSDFLSLFFPQTFLLPAKEDRGKKSNSDSRRKPEAQFV